MVLKACSVALWLDATLMMFVGFVYFPAGIALWVQAAILAVAARMVWLASRDHQPTRNISDEGLRRLEDRGASPELLAAARHAQRDYVYVDQFRRSRY